MHNKHPHQEHIQFQGVKYFFIFFFLISISGEFVAAPDDK